jgi:opacity protein-like surface antigen
MLSVLLILTLGIQTVLAKPQESIEKKETVEKKSSKSKKSKKTASKTKIKAKSKNQAGSKSGNSRNVAQSDGLKKPAQSKKPAPKVKAGSERSNTPSPARSTGLKKPAQSKKSVPKKTKPNKKVTPERVKGKNTSQRVERERPQGNSHSTKVTRKPPQKKVTRPIPAVKKQATQQAQARKKKKMNRRGMTSLGVQGLNYWSGYGDGKNYLDPGLGLAIGTRLLNGIGVELSYSAFSDLLLVESPERLNRPVQAVGQLYLMPSQKFSPFISAGVVANAIDLQDQYQWEGKEKMAEQESLLLGGVLGAGMEFNVSRHLGLKVEGRYFNYQNTVEGLPAIEDAFDISAGVSVYF